MQIIGDRSHGIILVKNQDENNFDAVKFNICHWRPMKSFVCAQWIEKKKKNIPSGKNHPETHKNYKEFEIRFVISQKN